MFPSLLSRFCAQYYCGTMFFFCKYSISFEFSGLKVLMVCCEDRLATEWYRIYQAMETIVAGQISKNSHHI